ncbi:Putative ribonuclease H protein At1g65750 [Linum perenne]
MSFSHSIFADDLVLFSEAYAAQARVVSDILNRLCEASGQNVSKPKSLIYCSRNTPATISPKVIDVLGIAPTPNLGRYLGVPILNGRVTKHTYDFLLDRLDSRWVGWKTASVLVSVFDKIDRKIRNFIWGSTDGVRKLHNVNWDTVCKPKNHEGLGLRSAREMNKAFLMKVSWIFINKLDDLWAKTIISKYLVCNDVGFTLKRNSGFSSLWIGVLKVWDNTLIRWCIKNGKTIKFWMARWLMTNEEKQRRHLTADAACQECNVGREYIEHVLCKCQFAKQVWRSLLPQSFNGITATSNFKVWWVNGIRKDNSSLMFGVIALLLWRRRNRLVFHDEHLLVSEFCSQTKFRIHLYSSS